MNPFRRFFIMQSSAVAALSIGGASDAQPSGDACSGSAQRLARNKQTVHDFYDLAFNQSKPAEAIARYAGATYIQHNAEVKDGKQGFIDYFNGMGKRYGSDGKGKRVEFKRTLAEGDLVTVHCQHTFREWHGETVWAGIDIFRLDAEGKIVEHWDVLQKVAGVSTHGNGVY